MSEPKRERPVMSKSIRIVCHRSTSDLSTRRDPHHRPLGVMSLVGKGKTAADARRLASAKAPDMVIIDLPSLAVARSLPNWPNTTSNASSDDVRRCDPTAPAAFGTNPLACRRAGFQPDGAIRQRIGG